MARQVAQMTRELRRLGIEVVAVYREVRSGWIVDDRPKLDLAIEAAEHHNAVIVAESTDRLLRSQDFDSVNAPGAAPTEFEFERFMSRAKGVRFATLLDPDADWREVRSYQTKRGYGIRCQPGEKKRWRATVARRALLLWLEGASYREVAKETRTPTPTVQGWIRAFALGRMDFACPAMETTEQRQDTRTP